MLIVIGHLVIGGAVGLTLGNTVNLFRLHRRVLDLENKISRQPWGKK